MSYNTSVFNFSDLYLDIPNDIQPAYQNKHNCLMIGERKFYNKSKSIFMSVRLAYDYNYIYNNKSIDLLNNGRNYGFLGYKSPEK